MLSYYTLLFRVALLFSWFSKHFYGDADTFVQYLSATDDQIFSFQYAAIKSRLFEIALLLSDRFRDKYLCLSGQFDGTLSSPRFDFHGCVELRNIFDFLNQGLGELLVILGAPEMIQSSSKMYATV